jgi:hypothetical protein
MAGQHGRRAGTPAGRRFVLCGITCLVAGLAAGPARADTTLPPGGAAVPSSVWAGVPNQSALVRINTASDAIIATIPVHGACGEVAADSQQVWVSGGTPPGCSPGVSLVNPATNSMVTHLTAGGPSSGNALGSGGFWFGADASDLLNRVDTATNSVVGQLKLPGSLGSIAAGFGSVWVADQTNSAILRVAPG